MSVAAIDQIGEGLHVLEGDLDEAAFRCALGAEAIAWDIETTGLDWRAEQIGTVQLQVEGQTYVIRVGGDVPHRLVTLMEDPGILKILHHAMFDLRFLAHHWSVVPARVACTKIASKLVRPTLPCEDHSLAALIYRYMGISLDKGPRTSDWTRPLSTVQLRYAANDVRHLKLLYEQLDLDIRRRGLLDLRERCYAHLPTQVELEVGGFPDVFAY